MEHTTPNLPAPIEGGLCRYCGLRRNVFKIDRRGEETHRPPRIYRSSICVDCATYLHDGGWSIRFDHVMLARIAAYAKAHPVTRTGG